MKQACFNKIYFVTHSAWARQSEGQCLVLRQRRFTGLHALDWTTSAAEAHSIPHVESFLRGLSWELFTGQISLYQRDKHKNSFGENKCFCKAYHPVWVCALIDRDPIQDAFSPVWAFPVKSSGVNDATHPKWGLRGTSPSFFTHMRFSRRGWCFITAFMYLHRFCWKNWSCQYSTKQKCVNVWENLYLL